MKIYYEQTVADCGEIVTLDRSNGFFYSIKLHLYDMEIYIDKSTKKRTEIENSGLEKKTFQIFRLSDP